jgi:hypothetical protein
MTTIFIDIPILLEHLSQVAKGVFLRYHLSIESNITLLRHGGAKTTHHVLCFKPTKAKTFLPTKSVPTISTFGQPPS